MKTNKKSLCIFLVAKAKKKATIIKRNTVSSQNFSISEALVKEGTTSWITITHPSPLEVVEAQICVRQTRQINDKIKTLKSKINMTHLLMS